MNIVQLQDLLKGLPDNRLKQEMDQPTGSVPQYLVLSEIVRRDKMRTTGMAQSPQTTVVQDMMNQRPGPPAMPPEQMQQEQAPQGYASGGFISAADAMGGAGVRGFAPPAPKQPPMFGPNYGGPGMFTPNTAPKAPTPMTNNNFNLSQPQPQFDGGQVNDFNSPSFYQQGAYADGGVIGYDLGGKITSVESGGNPRAKNPLSTATGLGQFIESTWLSTLEKMKPGLIDKIGRKAALDLRNDPVLSKQATDVYAAENRNMLTRRGFEPTEGNIYLAHFAGPGGAAALLGADPSESAGKILGEKVVKANPFLKNMSVADVKNWAAKKMGGKPGESTMAQAEISSGTGSNTAGIASLPDGKSKTFMPEMASFGKALVEGGNNDMPQMDIPEITPGSAELAAGTRTISPEEQLAQYAALRRGYMANGGAVRMQDGPPNGDAVRSSPTDEEIETYLRNRSSMQQLGAAGKDLITLIPRAFGGAAEDLGIAGLVGSVIGDPSFKFIDPATRESMTPYSDVLRKEGTIDGGFFEAPVVTPEKIEEFKSTQNANTPVDTSISTPMDRSWTPPERFTRKPQPGIFDEPPEPPAPTAEEQYITYLKERDAKLEALYDEQIKAEQERQAQASGLPAFLRQMGLGMLSNNRSMGDSLRAGLSGAIGSREDQSAEALDRIRALQLKKQMGGIEGLGDIAKLKYDTEVARRAAEAADVLRPKDYLGSVDEIGRLLADAKEKAEGAGRDVATDPEVLMYTDLLQKAFAKSGMGGTISGAAQLNWNGTELVPAQ